jgi:hypothetical protein
MSGIEVVGLLLGALGLFPIVTDAWDRYRENSPEVETFEALETRFKVAHHLYRSGFLLLFSGQNFEAVIDKPQDWTEGRIQRTLEETELQRPGTKGLLEIIKPTAKHINKGLEEFKSIFAREVSVTLLSRAD